MDLKNLALAEVEVLVRALVFALVPMVVMFAVTREIMSIGTYGLLVAVLFVGSNVVFAYFKIRDNGTIEMAMALEDSLGRSENE